MSKLQKTKRILTALLHLFRPSWWKKNWQRVAWCFSLAILAFFICFRFIPVPFSAYMAQQKIGHLLQLDFSYSIKYDWVSLDEISPNMQLAVIAAEDQNSPTTGALILRQFKRPLNLMKNLAEPEALQRFLNKQQKTSFSGMDKVGFAKD